MSGGSIFATGPGPLTFGIALISVMLIAAGWWGLVLNGWRRLTGDLDDRSPVTGVVFVMAGVALIAVSVWNIVDVVRTGSALH